MQTSLFDLENRYASLSEAGDPLERLDAVIDWEIFRPILARIDAKERKTAAGRKPTCRVRMFKLLVLQRLHNLSDERLQYQVSDRLSFMRFLGLELSGNVPDARTVWAFRESLKEHGLVDALFEQLNQALVALGVELKSGQIIDATFVPVPIQRNGRETNEIIKSNAVPIEWGKTPAKLAQKDIDARWTKKGGQNHYGFKNHINIDKDTKLITASTCTAANVHDSQALDTVLRDEATGGKEVWADSAYRSDEQEQGLKASQHESRIHERAYRNKPLTEAQELSNTEKSRVRARVEHVFGAMENEMGGIFLRSIGAARAAVGVGLMNLTYNLKRIETLVRLRVFDFDRIAAPRLQTMA
ncbi:MAG: IS5 family transposase [Sulfuritalea sp.]|nr:IS5 family transposase [Sulfuritalea sp.]